MAKVSIGLRGWRFDESAVFDSDGEFRPLAEMDDDTRRRVLRLAAIHDRPCHACYLIHGEGDIQRCRQATVVYGESMAEVLVCAEHELDFDYWYFEAGGETYRGTDEFPDRFQEWFADGGRAPVGYEEIDHVDTAPDEVPTPRVPDMAAFNADPPGEAVRLDLGAYGAAPPSSGDVYSLDGVDLGLDGGNDAPEDADDPPADDDER